MGAFAQKLKKIFNPKSGVKSEPNEFMQDYFIRRSDKPDSYMHYVGESNGEKVYVAKEGHVGAAVWKWKAAWKFIAVSGKSNLEIIRVDQVPKANG